MTEPPPPLPDAVDTRLLGHVLNDIRTSLAEHQTLMLQIANSQRKVTRQLLDMERRIDARMITIRDDIELMLKSELLGRLTHFETRSEQRLIDGMAHSVATLQEALATAQRQAEQAAADRFAAVEELVAASERNMREYREQAKAEHDRELAALREIVAAAQTQPERR